jgi:acylphosphatase
MRINIIGKVYKTGLRYFIKEKASRLKINGSVFYQKDHSVGVVAMGNKPNMDEFIRYCRHGNKDTLVEDFQVEIIPFTDDASFDVVDDILTEKNHQKT